MTTKPYIAFATALFITAIPLTPLQAATFVPSSDEVASLRSESEGDVYAASNSVVITAPVRGDIFAAGDGVDISGSADSSIFAVGRNLAITGDVQDDVRVAGTIVSIGSNIAHDLFAAGSNVLITKDSHVHGDAYLAGENITIEGTVHGDVQAAGKKLTIARGAVVMGNLTMRGNEPIIEEGATVSGKIQTIAPTKSEHEGGKGFALAGFITSVVSAMVLALVLLFAAPVLVAKSKENIVKSPVQSGLLGFLWLIICLPATLLLLISGVGAYVGIFILAVTFPLCILAFGLIIIATGSIVYQLFAKQEGTVWHHAAIGSLLVSLVALLGFAGFSLLVLAFFVALGALLKTLWSIIQGK